MTTYNVSRSSHAVLVPNAADMVVLDAAYRQVTVANRGSAYIYITTDGTVPTVLGTDTMILPPQTSADFAVLAPIVGDPPSTTTVGLISGSNVPYSVSVAPLAAMVIGTLTGDTDYQTAEQVQGAITAAVTSFLTAAQIQAMIDSSIADAGVSGSGSGSTGGGSGGGLSVAEVQALIDASLIGR